MEVYNHSTNLFIIFTFTNRSQTVVMPFASKNRIPKTIALEDEFPTTKLFND